MSDLKCIFEVEPVLEHNLTKRQKKKLNFFRDILVKNNTWAEDLSNVFDKFYYEIDVKGCNKDNFMRILSSESIFEHAFYCNHRYYTIFESSCMLCFRLYSFSIDEETCFYLDYIDRSVCRKYFKSKGCQYELTSFSLGFLSPFTVQSKWLDASKKANSHADDLVRKYCIIAAQMFCNFFLSFHYKDCCKPSNGYEYVDKHYRIQIFKAAKKMMIYLISNVN